MSGENSVMNEEDKEEVDSEFCGTCEVIKKDVFTVKELGYRLNLNNIKVNVPKIPPFEDGPSTSKGCGIVCRRCESAITFSSIDPSSQAVGKDSQGLQKVSNIYPPNYLHFMERQYFKRLKRIKKLALLSEKFSELFTTKKSMKRCSAKSSNIENKSVNKCQYCRTKRNNLNASQSEPFIFRVIYSSRAFEEEDENNNGSPNSSNLLENRDSTESSAVYTPSESSSEKCNTVNSAVISQPSTSRTYSFPTACERNKKGNTKVSTKVIKQRKSVIDLIDLTEEPIGPKEKSRAIKQKKSAVNLTDLKRIGPKRKSKARKRRKRIVKLVNLKMRIGPKEISRLKKYPEMQPYVKLADFCKPARNPIVLLKKVSRTGKVDNSVIGNSSQKKRKSISAKHIRNFSSSKNAALYSHLKRLKFLKKIKNRRISKSVAGLSQVDIAASKKTIFPHSKKKNFKRRKNAGNKLAPMSTIKHIGPVEIALMKRNPKMQPFVKLVDIYKHIRDPIVPQEEPSKLKLTDNSQEEKKSTRMNLTHNSQKKEKTKRMKLTDNSQEKSKSVKSIDNSQEVKSKRKLIDNSMRLTANYQEEKSKRMNVTDNSQEKKSKRMNLMDNSQKNEKSKCIKLTDNSQEEEKSEKMKSTDNSQEEKKSKHMNLTDNSQKKEKSKSMKLTDNSQEEEKSKSVKSMHNSQEEKSKKMKLTDNSQEEEKSKSMKSMDNSQAEKSKSMKSTDDSQEEKSKSMKSIENAQEEEKSKSMKSIENAQEEEKSKSMKSIENAQEEEKSKSMKSIENALEEEKPTSMKSMDNSEEEEKSKSMKSIKNAQEEEKSKSMKSIENALEEEKSKSMKSIENAQEEEKPTSMKSMDNSEEEEKPNTKSKDNFSATENISTEKMVCVPTNNSVSSLDTNEKLNLAAETENTEAEPVVEDLCSAKGSKVEFFPEKTVDVELGLDKPMNVELGLDKPVDLELERNDLSPVQQRNNSDENMSEVQEPSCIEEHSSLEEEENIGAKLESNDFSFSKSKALDPESEEEEFLEKNKIEASGDPVVEMSDLNHEESSETDKNSLSFEMSFIRGPRTPPNNYLDDMETDTFSPLIYSNSPEFDDAESGIILTPKSPPTPDRYPSISDPCSDFTPIWASRSSPYRRGPKTPPGIPQTPEGSDDEY